MAIETVNGLEHHSMKTIVLNSVLVTPVRFLFGRISRRSIKFKGKIIDKETYCFTGLEKATLQFDWSSWTSQTRLC